MEKEKENQKKGIQTIILLMVELFVKRFGFYIKPSSG